MRKAWTLTLMLSVVSIANAWAAEPAAAPSERSVERILLVPGLALAPPASSTPAPPALGSPGEGILWLDNCGCDSTFDLCTASCAGDPGCESICWNNYMCCVTTCLGGWCDQ